MNNIKIKTVFTLTALFMLSTVISIIPVSEVSAIDCNGTAAIGDDCTLADVGSISGTYRTLIAGDGTFEDQSSGTVSITVPTCSGGPATIAQATLSWAIRDSDTGYWEDGVNLAVDAGAPVAVTHDRRYKADGGGLGYSSYSADVTAQVLSGTHTYDVTNIDTSGTPDFSTTQWGFGFHVVYECPEFDSVTIYQKDGLDLHWYGWGAGYNTDRSEVYCQTFTASAVARTIGLDVFLPGSASANREADIWYSTGTGTPPAGDLTTDVDTGANGGQVLERLVIRSDGLPHNPEWDQYENDSITIPAGNEYVCFQVDSSFLVTEHPDDAAASGASMFSGGMWITVEDAVSALLTLGDYVWEDVDNDGQLDGSESGICDVDLHLYQDIGSAGYDSTVEGTTPLATTTTDCGATDGEYQFTNLVAAQYCVLIPQAELTTGGTLDGYVSSTGTVASASGPYESAPDVDDDVNDDDNGTIQNPDGIVSCGITLASGTEPTTDGDVDNNTNMTADFGVFEPAQLGDYVWYDTNEDGLQDAGEDGAEGVTVSLCDATTDSIATTATDAFGAYSFDYLIAGDYCVVFSNLPSDYDFTTTAGGDETSDSDADDSGRTELFSVVYGGNQPNLDAGLIDTGAAIGDDELADTGSVAARIVMLGLIVVAGAFMPLFARQLKTYRHRGIIRYKR